MKFGLVPINVGVSSLSEMTDLAQIAERCGYESVWTFEHVVVPIAYESKYPYNAEGKMGTAPDTNFVDPLIALAHIAANTSTLRLGTGVNILPQVNPLYLAKQAASLDFVSGGRLELGLGIGWLKEEFAALGIPFARRGERFDEYMGAMRKVWSGAVVEHQSEHISWSGFQSYPCAPGLRVVMGGNKGKIFQRTARFAQGWFAPTTDAEELRHGVEALRAACTEIQRDPQGIEISCMWNGKGGQQAVAALADAGAQRLLIPIAALGGDPIDGIEALAAEVMAD